MLENNNESSISELLSHAKKDEFAWCCVRGVGRNWKMLYGVDIMEMTE